MIRLIAALALVFTLPAWSADDGPYIEFDDQHLRYGRGVWLGSCEACHGYGVAGAPIPMKPRHWRERVTKDRSGLYDHAINGFFGEDDTMMPPRGGDPRLSDRQVRAAVDYMLELANHYIHEEEK